MPNPAYRRLLENLNAASGHRMISFEEFTDEMTRSGEQLLRNIFQIFHDMIYSYIDEVVDEYPDDSESIGYLQYDLDRLFIHDTRKPFFADRLFANRLVKLATSFRMSAVPNKIFLFTGPAGSGKSTFLNNLLDKFEQYMRMDEGLLYEVVWRIPCASAPPPVAPSTPDSPAKKRRVSRKTHQEPFFDVPCPNHDNPLLMIPRADRVEFIKTVIPPGELQKNLFKHRQYQWVFKNEPCTICSSIFQALTERYSVEEVFGMVHARRLLFNRKQGLGLSVYNAGDEVEKTIVRSNERIQQFLNDFFQDSHKVSYVYSSYARTNQGVRALMDLKARNVQRFLDLHGIISDEVHKVHDLEERIQSLFIVLMNPGDLKQIYKKEKGEGTDDGEIDSSLKDRLHEIHVPYVLDYMTEIRIYALTFGEQIRLRFMPRILENFARVIVASRIQSSGKPVEDWLEDKDAYEHVCDDDWRILKMDLYAGRIPDWLTPEDREGLKAEVRKTILSLADGDGHEGFSGRESQHIFNEFYGAYSRKRPITMKHLQDFFLDENRHYREKIPRGFLGHLESHYDHEVLREVKDCVYAYSEEEISRTILHYLVALPASPGDLLKNPYLDREEFKVTEDFFNIVESHLIGPDASEGQRKTWRERAIREYASQTLAREIQYEGKDIQETKQYLEYFDRFTRTARENVLEPFVENSNFRNAVKEFGSPDFEKYDTKLREKVQQLFRSMEEKYGYDEECGRLAVLHVIDRKLHQKFKK